MTVLELLGKTRELLSSSSDWVKGALRQEGAYCLVGALQYAYKHETYSETTSDIGLEYNQARIRCQVAIWESTSGQEYDPFDPQADLNLPDIPPWNDADNREHDEILDCIERAMKIESRIIAAAQQNEE